jgi:hypothetical protein
MGKYFDFLLFQLITASAKRSVEDTTTSPEGKLRSKRGSTKNGFVFFFGANLLTLL